LDTHNDDDLNKKKKNINDESKVSLNDINQLKIRVKSIGITFDEMKTIQVKIYFYYFNIFLCLSRLF
jgi:hypothetical protein